MVFVVSVLTNAGALAALSREGVADSLATRGRTKLVSRLAPTTFQHCALALLERREASYTTAAAGPGRIHLPLFPVSLIGITGLLP